jgi:RNA polymerase sigma-70 factor (ECF subfamily)
MSPPESYLQKLIGLQSQLYAYVLTLLADAVAADDVLQETNLVLCRKADEFSAGTNFEAWAFRVARIQCLAYWKTRARSRLVLDDAALQQIASQAEARITEFDDRTLALRQCLAELPPRQRELLEKRYAAGGSIKELAEQVRRSVASLSQTLYRIRGALLACIRSRLEQSETPSI